MKIICLCAALSMSAGSAVVFTPTQLKQLVQSPKSFKPISSGAGENINVNTPTEGWNWGNALKLSRLKNDPTGWRLSFEKPYGLLKIAPKLNRLYTFKDDLTKVIIEGNIVTSGPFKNSYLEVRRYNDGSGEGDFSILSKSYAVSGGLGSEFIQGGDAQLFGYPTFAFIKYQSRFCLMTGVTCK